MMTEIRQGDLVLVVSAHAVRPWRGRVVASGPSWRGSTFTGQDYALVLPVERGRGWSKEPVLLRKCILTPIVGEA